MLAREDAWPGYRAYLESRTRGPKGPAGVLLSEFIREALAWGEPDRRRFAQWLFIEIESREVPVRWRFAGQADFRILPVELQREVLLPTLRNWIADSPDDPSPYRWLGIYLSSELLDPNESLRSLESAIIRDPSPLLPRLVLARRLMDQAWIGARTLPESYSGDLAVGIESLELAHAYIHQFKDAAIREPMRSDASHYMSILVDFEEFLEEGVGDFAAWCRERDRDYPWAKPGYWRP